MEIDIPYEIRIGSRLAYCTTSSARALKVALHLFNQHRHVSILFNKRVIHMFTR